MLQVLVLEDDYIVASHLARTLNKGMVRIVGPFADVDEGIRHVDFVDAAILDVRLGDDTALPVAECLLNQDKPFLFHSAYGQCDLPPRFRGVPHYAKPTSADRLLRCLHQGRTLRSQTAPLDPVAALPTLRLRARQHLADPVAADRLVESTLTAALGLSLPVATQATFERQMLDLLDDLFRVRGLDFLN